ncbi:MAG: S41 family peptidase [Opitutales bacterium]
MKFKQLALVGLPALALGLLVGTLWQNPPTRAFFDPEYWSGIGKVGEAMRLVHYKYVDEGNATYEHLSETAVSGLVNGLDKHSRYMSQKDFHDFELSSRRQYYGIGVVIFPSEGSVMIIRVFPGGGADAAGLRPGDRILSVESKEVENLSVAKVSELIRGDAGTQVSLVLEDENDVRREVRVSRGKVQMASVEDVRMIGDDVGFLRIEQFTLRTGEEFASALASLRESGMKFLAIDLRDNSGGLLKASVEVLGHFFDAGEVVVSIHSRARDGGVLFRSSGKGGGDCPTVVLINQGSASASEIVAGALQVTGKTKLVGESSYGKGSVQTIFTLDDGSGLRLTTARYFLPGDVAILEAGLSPDIKVACDDDTWSKLRRQRNQDPFADPVLFEKRFGFSPVEDQQLKIALSVLKGEPIEPAEHKETPQGLAPNQ